MGVFDHEHEQVVHLHDSDAGLRAIVAIHSTTLGPALGGTRMLPYASEEVALADVLQLARAMTYKSAAAGLNLGGGKAVIISDCDTDRTRLMAAYGRMLNRIGGHYITTEDVGTTETDMVVIGEHTKHVTGRPVSMGGSGDPSDATAWGLMAALRAVSQHLWDGRLEGRHVAVSGVGKVGSFYCGYLAEAGCRVTIADISEDAASRVAARYEVDVVSPDEVHRVECDVFAPCALGGALSRRTIPELRCQAVVGSANNQLAEPSCADALDGRGIVYIPDYIANAGGVINIAEELAGYDRQRALERVDGIGDTVLRILEVANDESITTAAAAGTMVARRLDQERARSRSVV